MSSLSCIGQPLWDLCEIKLYVRKKYHYLSFRFFFKYAN